MTSKSKIRQLALSALYSHELQGTQTEDEKDQFWEISLEKEQDRYRKALAKALLHKARHSADSYRVLVERATVMVDRCQGDITTAVLREDLARYLDLSKQLEEDRDGKNEYAALQALAYALTDKRADDTEGLRRATEDVLRLAEVLASLAESLAASFADFPAYREQLEPLKATINRRSRLLNELVILRDAHAFEASGELKQLVNAACELRDLRPAAEDLAEAVLTRGNEWDEIISPLLKNYSLDRIDLVDRCILYIALYELLANKLPLAVVIAESTALADVYSGSKSAPFIHGILASAAEQAQ